MATETGCTVFALLSAGAGGAVGYWVRFFLAKKTAKRKEDWDLLKDLNQHINDVVDQVVSFYCTQDKEVGERRAKAIQIQRMISQAAQKVHFLGSSLENKSLDGYLKRFRQTITKMDFDADITRPALELNDEKIVAIEEACNGLVGAINLAFTRNHRAVNF